MLSLFGIIVILRSVEVDDESVDLSGQILVFFYCQHYCWLSTVC